MNKYKSNLSRLFAASALILLSLSVLLPTTISANPDTETLRPNANGTTNSFSLYPDTGESNYEDVDEASADDDSTYVYKDTSGYVWELYNLPAGSGSGVINKITVYARARTTSGGNNDCMRLGVRTHDTNYTNASLETVTPSYANFSRDWTENPNTSSAWTWSEIDALQIGVYGQGSTGFWELRVTQVYVVIDYIITSAPTVTTNTSLGFGNDWAVLSGTITDDGNASITQIGFDYGTTDSYGSSWTQSGSWDTDDSFVGVVTDLTQATVYHYRAKAYNSEGWGYGDDMLVATKGSPVIYEYLNTGGDGASNDIYSTNQSAVSFTVGSVSHTITHFRVKIQRTGSPGTVTLSLKHADEAGLPTGDDLVSGTLDGDNLSTSYDWYKIDVTETTLEAGEKYAIVIKAETGDASNDIQWHSDTGGGLAGAIGSYSTDGGISWNSDTPEDYLFEIWGNACIEIVGGAVFEDYLETGDMLFLIHYKNIYEPYYPYDDVSQYFNLQLLDTNGSTLLHQVPCRQWGYMPGSVYINADSAAGITNGAGYYLRLYGTFSGNPSAQYQLTSSDWLGNIAAYLDQWVLNVAGDMEEYYEVDLTSTIAGQGTVLNDVGGVAFIVGVPELGVVRPELFEGAIPNINYSDDTFTDAFSAETTWQEMLGADAEAVAADAGDIFGLDDHTMIGIVLLIGYVGVAVFVFAKGYTTAGLALAFPFIIIAGVLRVIDIVIIGVIAAVALLLAVWSFWWTRT